MGPQPRWIYSSQPSSSKVSGRRRLVVFCALVLTRFLEPCLSPPVSQPDRASLPEHIYGPPRSLPHQIPLVATHTPQSSLWPLSAPVKHAGHCSSGVPLIEIVSHHFFTARTLTTPSRSPPKSPPAHPKYTRPPSPPHLVSHDTPPTPKYSSHAPAAEYFTPSASLSSSFGCFSFASEP